MILAPSSGLESFRFPFDLHRIKHTAECSGGLQLVIGWLESFRGNFSFPKNDEIHYMLKLLPYEFPFLKVHLSLSHASLVSSTKR